MASNRAIAKRAAAWSFLLSAALALCGSSGVVRTQSGGRNPGITYPWRFAYVTDTHCRWVFGGGASDGIWNDYQLGKFIDSMNVAGIDFMILGGDWAEDIFPEVTAGRANQDSFEAKLAAANFTIYPVIGNHETSQGTDLTADTTAGTPFRAAENRWGTYFNSAQRWYYKDHKNIRFIALQNCANVDTGATSDYILLNPFNSYGFKRNDYDGITDATSPQRIDLASYLGGRDKSHWVITAAHRAIYGSDANSTNRLSLRSQMRGDGYIKQIEDSLGTGERGLNLVGDQHIPLWFTVSIEDSSLSSATEKGLYHFMVASGSGARLPDSTEYLGNTSLAAFLGRYNNAGLTNDMMGRTSAGWADTLTQNGYTGDVGWFWTGALFTVYGDHILVETFAVQTSRTAGHAQHRGAGALRLVDSRTITRDN